MTPLRLKVCLASLATAVGEAEVVAERLALGLREAGHDVFLLLGRPGAVQERLERAGLRCVVSPMPPNNRWDWLRSWWARRGLTRLLRQEWPDLIHSNDLPTHEVVSDAVRGLSIPRICHHRSAFSAAAIDRALRFGAEHHLFDSEALMKEMCAESPRLKLSSRGVLPDGLPSLAAPDAARRSQARQALGLPVDRVIVTTTGPVNERDGVADLIRAWSLLDPGLRERSELVVLGDGRAGGPGAPVRFVGVQKNVPEWLTAADVAVAPSAVELLGNGVLEAMSLALPVVGSRVNGTSESVVHEQTGLLVPPQVPAALAEALSRLLTDEPLRQRLGEAGRLRAVEWLGLQAQATAALEQYDRVLKACHGSTLLITEIFPPKTGGSGRWFGEIYRRLPAESYLVAAGEHPQQGAYDATHDRRLARVPLTLASWGVRSFSEWAAYGKAIRAALDIVRTQNVRMIHCGRCLPEGLMALALGWLSGTRFCCYVHGEDMTLATTSRELTWLTRRVVNQSAYFIANSKNTARILLESWGIAPQRVHVLHPGVDTTRFVPAARDAGVRAELGWGDRPVILTAGRLQKRKGQDTMIQALGRVREAIPDVLYAIVGDGEERQALHDMVAKERLGDHVQFLGEIRDEVLYRCYQQCDLFALPNRQVGQDIEGFGMVLLEAQACGRPVLAGTSGGTAETMRVPETGWVVPCDGPDQLAPAIIDLLSDRGRLDRMGAAGRQWVVEHFDWAALTRQALELFTRFDRVAPGKGAV